MKYAVIISAKDQAGLNIKNNLLNLFSWQQKGEFNKTPIYHHKDISLYTVPEYSIFCEHLDKEIDADVFIFATTHKSESGLRCLTVHAPGNWGNAEMGGLPQKLCIAPALLLRKAYLKLEEYNSEYTIAHECTHHGPFLDKPCMFIEIGSTEKEWTDKKAAEIIAETIMYCVTTPGEKAKVALGIGGPHYLPNFAKLIERNNIAFGHVCPKYALSHLTKEMLKQALEKNMPPVEEVILEWKGLGKEKERITTLLKEMNIPFSRI
jgi:D-aminoacyl-tRNA deacylase